MTKYLILTDKDYNLLMSEKAEGINLLNVGKRYSDLPKTDCEKCIHQGEFDKGYCAMLKEHPGTNCAQFENKFL